MNYKFTDEAYKGVDTLLQRDLQGIVIKQKRAAKIGNKDLEHQYKEQSELISMMIDLVGTTVFMKSNKMDQSQ